MDIELKNKEWKEFLISDIFTVNTGALVHKDFLKRGDTPRITATSSNNGVYDYYSDIDHENYRTFENFISVSFLGSVFYHPYKASLDMKIHSIVPRDITLNKYTAFFITTLLKKTTSNFSYGSQLSSTVLSNKRIILPVYKDGSPDYKFMEDLMMQKEQVKIEQYNRYINKRLETLQDYNKVELIGQREFAEFEIGKLFNIKSGKRLTKSAMKKGNKPFIGATDSNNGITEYVSNTNNSEDSNVLGVNYNGSVVENFYHPYRALFSDDVKRLSLKKIEGNKYLYLYAKTQILKQKNKYQYGYKFNAKRMEKQKIMLPVNNKNEPDYEYMESYMKYLEYKKIEQYIKYIDK